MGIFQNAWATYRLAKSRQRELTKAFAEIGVNFMHLDTNFTTHLIKGAIKTDAATVATKYSPLLHHFMLVEGSVVTPAFNRRLALMFTRLLQQTDND